MQNSDEAIERVLTGLRNTEAPEGLTQRIHQSLEAGSNHRRQTVPRQSLRSLFSVRALTFAAALAVLVSTICWNAYRNSQSKVTHTTAHEPPAISTANHPSAVAQAMQPMRLPPRSVTAIQKAAHSRSTKPGRLQAASYPAPEAPLTDEERLLLRLAHGADPKTLEAYSPAQNEAHLAQQKADFQQFFDPPATVNNE